MPRRAPKDDGLEEDSASALISAPSDPNTTSHPIAALASSDAIAALPKPQQPQQEKRLDPAYVLYRVEPAYPHDAQVQHIEGTVKMRVHIGQDGRVRKIELVSGPPLLLEAAMNAARDWRYIPAILDGQPVESDDDISIDFHRPH